MDFEPKKKNNSKKMISVFGICALVIGLLGTTLAFFNYTRTGSSNTIKVGRISFNSNYEAVNFTNAFPVNSSEASQANNPNVRTINVAITGDTDYSEGMEYLVSAKDVHVEVGDVLNRKVVPITIEAGVIDNNEQNPATTLGTIENGDYYTARTGYKQAGTSKYKVVYDGSLEEDERLLVGYIAPNQTPGTPTGIDGILVLKTYLDESKILISDTYPEGDVSHIENEGEEDEEEVLDYTNGTTSSMAEGKTVFTTEEWNNIQNNPLSFKIKVEANVGIWVPKPGSAPMSFDSSSEPIVLGNTRRVAITSTGDGEISCSSSDTTVATCAIDNGELVINTLKAGTAKITITQAAGHEYATPTVMEYDVEVEKISTTMSLASNSGTVTYGENTAITITTNGDGELTCSSSNNLVASCSISGTTLTINGVGAGTATITVSQAEGTTHLSSSNINYSVTISKIASSIACNASQDYTGNAIQTYSTYSGCTPTDNISVSNAGTYNVTCVGDANHSDSSCSFTVNKVAGTFSCSNQQYDGTVKTGCSCTGGELSGDYEATNTSQNGYTAYCIPDGNHTLDNGTVQVSKTWNITKELLTCPGTTGAESSETYTGSEITYNGNNCPSGSERVAANGTNVGTYYATCTADSNHEFAETCNVGILTITEAAATLTCSDKTYDGSLQTGCVCTNCTITEGTNTGTDVGGPWTVSATANANYTLATSSKTWSINKATLTCPGTTGAETTESYTGNEITYNGNNCPSGSQRVAASGTNVGTYYATCTADSNHEFNGTCNAGILTIEKAACTLEVTNGSMNTGSTMILSERASGNKGNLSYTIKTNGTTSASSINNGVLTAGAMSADNDTAQSVVVTITDAGNESYNGCSKDVVITVNKIANTVAANNQTVYVNSETPLANLITSNNGGALSANIGTDNTSGSSISGTNFVAGTLAANDDTNKTVAITVTSAGTTTVAQGTANVTVTVQKYTRELNLSISPSTVGYNSTASLSTTNGGSGGTPSTNITYSSGTTSVFTLSGSTITAVSPSGTSVITATRAGSTTVKSASTTATATATKGTCNPPSNVTIGTDKKVSWTASSNATSYEVCVASGSSTCTPNTALTSGSVYNAITDATGSRTVYVRSVCNSTNYNTPSTNASASTTVYSVTLTKGTGVSTVSGAGNYITGSTVTLGATFNNGYTWSKWTQTSGGAQLSTTLAYSAVINSTTGNWNYTANAVQVWAENLSYNNSNSTGINCTGGSANAQCALNSLASLLNQWVGN